METVTGTGLIILGEETESCGRLARVIGPEGAKSNSGNRSNHRRNSAASCSLLLLLGVLLCLVTPVQAKVVETSADGRIQVDVRQIRGHSYETLVVHINHRVIRLPDERVSDHDENGKLFVYNEDDPDSRIDHDFFLSPNGAWLFVTRKLFSPVNVGYLYCLSSANPAQIRPQGLRFEEAAIRYFSSRLHLPYPTIGSGARVITFERWTNDTLIFQLGINKSNGRQGTTYAIVGSYGLKSRRFGLISSSAL